MLKPKVEIEFSSIVELTAIAGGSAGVLDFRLFRVCNNGEPIKVNNWTYEAVGLEDTNIITLSTSFSFNFCEDLDSPGCCGYFVEVTSGDLIQIESLNVSNVQISALAQETSNCVKDKYPSNYRPKNKYPKQSLLLCGQGRKATFVNVNDPSQIVGCLAIDTSNMCSPTVIIEFSSIVRFVDTSAGLEVGNGLLTFELFRECHNECPVLLDSWNYEVSMIENNEPYTFSKSFNFNFCEGLSFTGCCKYFVKVSVDSLETATIEIDKVTITGLLSNSIEKDTDCRVR